MVINKPCANCSVPVKRIVTHNSKPIRVLCCSRRCKKLYADKTRPRKRCVVCGKEFQYYPSMGKRFVTCGDECRKKHKEGSSNGRWRGGIAHKRASLTHSGKNKLWRKVVLQRDKVCVDCGSCESLEVDHIQPWAAYPELRYEPSNGRVLCNKCHKKRARETFKKLKEAERLGIYAPRREERAYEDVVCPNCLTTFTPKNRRKIYCTIKCQRNKYARDSRKKSKLMMSGVPFAISQFANSSGSRT